MEILKARQIPELLTVLELLDKRMTLPYTEKQHMAAMSKGYDGEILFDSLIKKYITIEAIVINDVSMVTRSTPFQIDSILVTSDTLYLYEVKNYQGSFTNRNSHFLTAAGQDIENPVNQLNRTTMLFSKVLKRWNVNLPIKAFVVFIHPTFILYEAKESDPFIFPSQIENHFKTVNRQSGVLTDRIYNIAQRLNEECQQEQPYQRLLPDYNFEELKKGLLCGCCGSFDLTITTKKGDCRRCGNPTSINELFLSQVEAFKVLFPDKLVTSKMMYEWCGGTLTMRRISSILNATYEKMNYAKSTHYR